MRRKLSAKSLAGLLFWVYAPRITPHQFESHPCGINDSWATLRKTLQVQRRTTTSMRLEDGRAVHVRKTSKAEPALMRIYQALGINAAPGGVKKLYV